MADHVRRRIRDAAVDTLTGRPITGNNVFAGRRRPLQAGELPGLCIYTVSEESDVDDMGATRHLQREVSLVVEAVTQETERLDDALDDICVVVEAALNDDPTLGGVAYDLMLTATRIVLQPAESDGLRTGSAAMTFRVFYRTRKDDPTTIN